MVTASGNKEIIVAASNSKKEKKKSEKFLCQPRYKKRKTKDKTKTTFTCLPTLSRKSSSTKKCLEKALKKGLKICWIT